LVNERGIGAVSQARLTMSAMHRAADVLTADRAGPAVSQRSEVCVHVPNPLRFAFLVVYIQQSFDLLHHVQGDVFEILHVGIA
jgi:hypothetical protein